MSTRMSARDIDVRRQELVRIATSDVLMSRDRVIEAVESLRRLETGDYGTCASCGASIPPARLAVRPEATRCTACQAKYDEAWAA